MLWCWPRNSPSFFRNFKSGGSIWVRIPGTFSNSFFYFLPVHSCCHSFSSCVFESYIFFFVGFLFGVSSNWRILCPFLDECRYRYVESLSSSPDCSSPHSSNFFFLSTLLPDFSDILHSHGLAGSAGSNLHLHSLAEPLLWEINFSLPDFDTVSGTLLSAVSLSQAVVIDGDLCVRVKGCYRVPPSIL